MLVSFGNVESYKGIENLLTQSASKTDVMDEHPEDGAGSNRLNSSEIDVMNECSEERSHTKHNVVGSNGSTHSASEIEVMDVCPQEHSHTDVAGSNRPTTSHDHENIVGGSNWSTTSHDHENVVAGSNRSATSHNATNSHDHQNVQIQSLCPRPSEQDCDWELALQKNHKHANHDDFVEECKDIFVLKERTGSRAARNFHKKVSTGAVSDKDKDNAPKTVATNKSATKKARSSNAQVESKHSTQFFDDLSSDSDSSTVNRKKKASSNDFVATRKQHAPATKEMLASKAVMRAHPGRQQHPAKTTSGKITKVTKETVEVATQHPAKMTNRKEAKMTSPKANKETVKETVIKVARQHPVATQQHPAPKTTSPKEEAVAIRKEEVATTTRQHRVPTKEEDVTQHPTNKTSLKEEEDVVSKEEAAARQHPTSSRL